MLRVATHGRGIWELQVPETGNNRPSAVISSPVGQVTVAKGRTLSFIGTVSDGDSVSAVWTFSDDWQTVPAGAGTSTVSHTFNRPGIHVVGLAANDGHQARSAASLTIRVFEAPAITSAVFDGKKNLRIEGFGLGFSPVVLINNVDKTARVNCALDDEIALKGKAKKLGLRPGENTVQVIANDLASNTFTVRL